MAPSFVMRIAGLPMDALRRLRCEATSRAVDELLDVEEGLRLEGEQLSRALYDVVGGMADRGLRRQLITLRRCVYLARSPKAGVLDDRLRAGLPADLSVAITGWEHGLARRDALWVQAEATLASESAEKRRALATVGADDWFQQGLVLASPELYAELVKWLSEGPARRPDDQLEASLVNYVGRAAAKTTPYSTFTSVAEGSWTAVDADPVRCAAAWTRGRALEPAMRIVLGLRRDLASWPEMRSVARLRVNPSIERDGVILRFLSHRGLGNSAGEALAEATVTPTLHRVLELIRAHTDPRYAQVVVAVGALDPTSAAVEVAAYLDQLIDVGLVEMQLDVADQSLDHLGELSDSLSGSAGQRVDAVRESVARLRAQLTGLAGSSRAQDRHDSIREVESTLRSLSTQLDWTPRGLDVTTRNAVFEDTVVADLDCRFALPAWAGVLDDLRLLAGLSGLLDRFLPPRLALAAFFADRYEPGATVGFLEWCRAVDDERRCPGAVLGAILSQPWLAATGGLAELDEVQHLRRQVESHVRAAPLDQAGIRRLDRYALAGIVAALPAFARSLDSVAFYGQPMIRDGSPSFVLNNADAGFRRAHARARRFAARAHGDVHAPMRLPEQSGVVFADLATVGGSNLNLRLSPTRWEITYPGSVSNRPAEEQIALGELDVVGDPAEGRLHLVWRSRGLRVIPLHLGTLVDWALPWTYRLLMQTFGVATFSGLPERLSGLSFIRHHPGVRRVPRLRLGNVVIARATWLVSSDDAPLRANGESSLSYLIRVRRWLGEHGIPRQCFVRAAASGNPPTILGKTRKPCYVDFSNQVFLRVFAQIAARPGLTLVLQEVLPTDDDLLVTDGSAAYASECVFEFDW